MSGGWRGGSPDGDCDDPVGGRDGTAGVLRTGTVAMPATFYVRMDVCSIIKV